ncbi:hypothetical protein BOX15_Mlig018181g1 [Macrostomum lignano]|uniref:Integrase catalytic domain-containing protein n=1 Tax=Macrostomum lignano TaxID=282301 RepID=A0A267GHJ3_9PLAT|nr:hypothetical protein BOX15_Mlig018181g1 [Macrostomum lignano]
MPTVETIFSDVAGMTDFATLDLSDAYLQIELEEKSREVTTIATPLGLFRYTRLVPGLKSASAIFQKAMETTLEEVSGKVIYQDEILIGGQSAEGLKAKVDEVIKTLQAAGMNINLAKSNLGAKTVKFLGYRISADGISPDPGLVSKIMEISAPRDRRQLESFLGLCNFFGRFVNNYAHVVEHLNQLRKKGAEFVWGAAQEAAFHQLKKLLSSGPIIQPYDRAKETTLTTDASEKAVAAVLTQEGHPVIYFSRRLTQAEARYSNIEREALAIVWAMERARQFLLGKRFTLRTDHRPLEFLFGTRQQLPKVANARLLRWAIRLMGFDFAIEYVRGAQIPHADALSRLDFADVPDDQAEAATHHHHLVHWAGESVIGWNELAEETKRDRLLADVMRRIAGNRWSGCSPAERPFKAIRHALTIDDSVVCYGDRPVIPSSLRSRVLELVHSGAHPGASSTRALVRNSVWWPGYCGDVEGFVRACHTCAKQRQSGHSSVHQWPADSEPWGRIHMDHAHVPKVGLLLVLVDAMSAWPEAIRVPDKSAATVRKVLQEVFARNGVPRILVSDNAAEFHDEGLVSWLSRIGCRAVKTPPYHPQSNGLAERMVQTIKVAPAGWDQQESYDAFLARILLNYRCVPHAGREFSPAQLMGRQLRNSITMRTAIRSEVWYAPRRGAIPEKAEFLAQKGSNTALIVRQGNRVTLAHLDQLRRHEPDNNEGGATATTDLNGDLRSEGAAKPADLPTVTPCSDGPPVSATSEQVENQPAASSVPSTPEAGGHDRLAESRAGTDKATAAQRPSYNLRANRGVPPLRFEGGR